MVKYVVSRETGSINQSEERKAGKRFLTQKIRTQWVCVGTYKLRQWREKGASALKKSALNQKEEETRELKRGEEEMPGGTQKSGTQ